MIQWVAIGDSFTYLNDHLDEYTKTVMPNGTTPKVTYLSIAGALAPDEDQSKGIYTYYANTTAEIIDAMNDSRIQTRIVKEILGSIESLYRVASEREVKKIQDEFYEVFSHGNLEDLKRFQKQLDIIAEGYRAQSVDHPLLKEET